MATFDATVAGLSPLGWWKLNDAVNSTTAADSSGNGYNGTVHGTLVFGQTSLIPTNPSATAALFDGSTSYISLPNAAFPATGQAVSIMTTIAPIGASDGCLFGVRTAPNAYYTAFLFTSGTNHGVTNTPAWQINNGSFFSYYPSSKSLQFPLQLIATLDTSNNLTLYANGSKINSVAVAAQSGTVNTPAIGSTSGTGAGVVFHGVMAEVATFSSILTQTQVTSLWQAAAGMDQLIGFF